MSALVRLVSTLVLGVVLLAACGDDGGDVETSTGIADTSVTTPASVSPAPTELRFTFAGISGAADSIIVGTVADASGAVVGTVCLPVDSDPFSGMAVVATADPDNPCNQDAPFGVLLSIDGDYRFMIGTYLPGTQTPGMCRVGEVTVSGPTEVVVDSLSPDQCL